MATPGIPATHAISQNQRKAMRESKRMQDNENHSAITLDVQDIGETAASLEKIYVYNILALEHVVEQPPLFQKFVLQPCEKGKKFYVTSLPRYIKIPFEKPGTTEHYYKNEDGRKTATSLMNPSAYPGTDWNAQIQKWDTGDQTGNNLNAFGCWWSLTKPDDPKIDEEIAIFKKRWIEVTAKELIATAESLNAAGKRDRISPLMHFAMDYLGKQAPWHMASEHMVSCPNCGDLVKEGIAYHKNAFGEKCIIDRAKCIALGILPPDPVATAEADQSEEMETASVAPAGKPKGRARPRS